jgi:CRISPR-associated protein Csd2
MHRLRVYVNLASDAPKDKIYVQHRGILANEQKRAYTELNLPPQDSPNARAQAWMCQNYYDVRMFGAVMSTGKAPVEGSKKDAKWNCGQVRGPLQFTFARSIDPIAPLDLSITRVALTNAGDTRKEDADEEEAGSGQMGRKWLLPYGLYLGKGFFSANLSGRTGVTRDDLKLFWDALQTMWDLDRSASRGMMACRGLYIFSHDNPLGNAPAHVLFGLVDVPPCGEGKAPRSFEEYRERISVPTQESLLPGVTLTRLVG